MSKQKYNNLITGLAIASLFVAFFIGNINTEKNRYANIEATSHHEITRIEHIAEGDFAYKADKNLGRVAVAEAQGYGGPLKVVVLADSLGAVQNVFLGKNSETVAYITKLKRNAYFDQYHNKTLGDAFVVHNDLDAVSGATISSVAISHAVRQASHQLAEDYFSMPVKTFQQAWNFGLKEILAIVIFVLAFLSAFLRNKKLKIISLSISLVVLGFMFNSSVSVSHFGRLLLGYFPDIHEHFVWWLLMGSTLLAIIFYGRNIYCHAMCPFNMVQTLLNKLSGMNLHVTKEINKVLIRLPKVLLWVCLMLILLSKNSTLASYEPFSLVFSLEGVGIQWYIMPAALFGSLMVSNFFCRYFCPVGAGFNLVLKARTHVVKKIKK